MGEPGRARSEGMISRDDVPYLTIVSVYPLLLSLRHILGTLLGGWWSTDSET